MSSSSKPQQSTSMEEVDLEKGQEARDDATPSTANTGYESRAASRFWWVPDVKLDPRVPVKTTIVAVTLLTAGVGLLLWGLVLAAEGKGLGHLFLGFMTATPGAYATVQLYGAYRGWRGYAFENIPSYDTSNPS
ncbi:hypothetical protein SPRG_11843 [Saprolegnia parasitica CBS 223.65]|uniref:Transmembrane protein 230 n=1 Tax=Saprolegnia parasitica (strain CBS 223.65) TaxID=695850 RepID=A0A067C8V7_SAPPC|nr:hypothetical protein SPRG_11843 [Saprolegnia parasitica CBS 223.65]KDO22996.1 hypothetical protein SPRG_11843 [Saprolegnia parasitica CBS 223.65]|eukprot:XP_012206287.1 hypothetical protein SPRG_11843 [Saprolegnia parasitica CBS 223.65]